MEHGGVRQRSGGSAIAVGYAGGVRVLVLSLALLLASCSRADMEEPIYTPWRNSVAVGGYDAVSFFAGAPVRGRRDITYAHNDAVWRFATEANRDLFALNPEAFVPEYGGYDAWALAHGKLARGSPERWSLDDGRLFFNFNDRTQRLWELRQSEFVARADANWPDVLER